MANDRRPRALLIEDDEDYLLILRSLCEEESLAADTAIDGNDAIRQLAAGEYAVVILDLQLPGLDGISIIDYLRHAQPALLERVVIFTGFSNIAQAIAPDLPTVAKSNMSRLRSAIRRAIRADAPADQGTQA